MPTTTKSTRKRKKASNLSIDNRPRERAKWLKKNRAALDAYNDQVKTQGVFSDGLRSF